MWVSVAERLPDEGREVYVRGKYTPDGVEKPKAVRVPRERAGLFNMWSSREWRGTVGITHWWDDELQPIEEERIICQQQIQTNS